MGQQVDIECNRILTDEGSIFELSLTTEFPKDIDPDDQVTITAQLDWETMNKFYKLIEGMLLDSSLEFFEEIVSITEQ